MNRWYAYFLSCILGVWVFFIPLLTVECQELNYRLDEQEFQVKVKRRGQAVWLTFPRHILSQGENIELTATGMGFPIPKTVCQEIPLPRCSELRLFLVLSYIEKQWIEQLMVSKRASEIREALLQPGIAKQVVLVVISSLPEFILNPAISIGIENYGLDRTLCFDSNQSTAQDCWRHAQHPYHQTARNFLKQVKRRQFSAGDLVRLEWRRDNQLASYHQHENQIELIDLGGDSDFAKAIWSIWFGNEKQRLSPDMDEVFDNADLFFRN